MFQQDAASSHISMVAQAHLDETTPQFIKKHKWPPQSPDCCPMDYAIWDSLKEKVYREVHIQGGAKVGIQLYHISEISGILYRSESNIS